MNAEKKGTQELRYKQLIRFIELKYAEINELFEEGELEIAIGDLIVNLELDGIYENKFLNDKTKIMKLLEILIFLYINVNGEFNNFRISCGKLEEKNKKLEEKNKMLQKEVAELKRQLLVRR